MMVLKKKMKRKLTALNKTSLTVHRGMNKYKDHNLSLLKCSLIRQLACFTAYVI